MERTLVLVKPDGVRKKVIGAVIDRFEKKGMRIVALKMLVPTKRLAMRHYVLERAWYEGMWRNANATYKKNGRLLTERPVEMGRRVRNALIKDLTAGPVVAIVVEGVDAVSKVRKECGSTEPASAEPRSIRGMYSKDSYKDADRQKRAIRNIVHASDAAKTADREISVWFTKKELAG